MFSQTEKKPCASPHPQVSKRPLVLPGFKNQTPSSRRSPPMIFGMTPFTFFHVLISLIGIGSGFIVVFGMIAGKRVRFLERHFSHHHRAHQRHRFLFPISRFQAVLCARHPVADCSRHSHSRPLHQTFGRPLAPHLCDRFGHRPLFQRLRPTSKPSRRPRPCMPWRPPNPRGHLRSGKLRISFSSSS